MSPAASRKSRAPRAGGERAAEKLSTYLAGSSPRTAPQGGRGGVLPDTCAWIDYFRGDGALGEALDKTLRQGPVHTCGPVVFELVQGVRAETEKSALLNALGTLEYCEMDARTWLAAGELAAGLRRKGKTLPFSDLLVAALAIGNGLSLLTSDRHFQEIPGVVLHR